MISSNIILITGPTSIGKTSVALKIAKSLDGCLVNSDKFHLFKEFEIGIGIKDSQYGNDIQKYLYQILEPTDAIPTREEYLSLLIQSLDNQQNKLIPIIEGCSFSYNEQIIKSNIPAISFCLIWDSDTKFRKKLHDRINNIFDLGLVEETQRLLSKGYEISYGMTKGILYRSVIDYLDGISNLASIKLRIVNDLYRNAQYQKKRYLKLRQLLFIDGLKSQDSIFNDMMKAINQKNYRIY